MVKSKLSISFVLTLVFLGIVFGILFIHTHTTKNIEYFPHVRSMHVINLDKDISRWENIQNTTQDIDMKIERFPAVNGKELSADEMYRQGIGFMITHPGIGTYSESKNNPRRNLGVVGCYLSHRNLLEHVSRLQVPDHYGHLILEDDVNIPRNFLQPGDEWHKVYQSVPQDWDIVYLSITKPIGYNINPKVMRLQHNYTESGNWGTHAYLVKHGSIRTKILPWLRYMIDAIDEQYRLKFNEWNVYAVVKDIIPLNTELSAVSSVRPEI